MSRFLFAAALGVVSCGGVTSPPSPQPLPPSEPSTSIVPVPLVPWAPTAPARERITRCHAVAHLGDSTSTGMTKSYIRDPADRIDAQYIKVGVLEVRLESSGGRSLVEHRPENENGVMAARRLRESGYTGCWVVALGTNDAANVARSPRIGPKQRIERLMEVIGDDPVLWVDVVTRKDQGYYANANMQRWNAELESTLAAVPTAKVYRWSEEAQENWFVKDGIHYNSQGLLARAAMIPAALLEAFPEETP